MHAFKILLRPLSRLLVLACLVGLLPPALSAQFIGDVEAGYAFTSYNRIGIPGNTGDRFDANELLDPEGTFIIRLRAGYRFNDRHNVFALFAPLQLTYQGTPDRDIFFFGQDFEAGNPTTVSYKFNSYRLTYRYDFLRNDRWRLGAGVTAKIRNAFIQMEQEDRSSIRRDLGFVPIINVYARYFLNDKFDLLFEGDGLASPQGRAFDFRFAVPIQFTEQISIQPGYRLLEGGSDIDAVYSFAWVNYFTLNAGYRF